MTRHQLIENMIALLLGLLVTSSAMPLPFKRELYLTSPAMTGNDVIIAQNLLLREPAVTSFNPNGVFESSSETAVKQVFFD